MDTALYYGFSTIAQTIATAIALLGALVLFRLQGLAAAMRTPATILTSNFHVDGGGKTELNGLLISEDFAAIEQAFTTGRYRDAADRNPDATNARTTLNRLIASRQRILRDLRQSLTMTAVLIGGSILVIFLVPVLSQWAWAAWGVAILGVGAFSACVWLYTGLVAQIVDG